MDINRLVQLLNYYEICQLEIEITLSPVPALKINFSFVGLSCTKLPPTHMVGPPLDSRLVTALHLRLMQFLIPGTAMNFPHS